MLVSVVPQEEQGNPGGFSFPLRSWRGWFGGAFTLALTPCARLLQKEKSKDFRNHVTKYLETLLNSQQQVSDGFYLLMLSSV